MAGVKNRTGNPGVKNSKKRSSTSFTVSPLKEPKSNKIMGFKPSLSLEEKIKTAINIYSISQSDFLEKAAIAYLELLEQKSLPIKDDIRK
ncbi:hypothetical protein RIVM261_053390 [Rivularia sp. IAM M-261]|nr:hypothetical protein RIVM261_053390 [Rivularia sp. IAM M-261]